MNPPDRPDQASQPEPADDHERFALDVAGYVLGGLTVAEQQAFEAHLATCAACRHELDELDPLPVLLDLSASPTPAPGVLDPEPIEPIEARERAGAATVSGGHDRSGRRGRRGLVVGAVGAVVAVAAAFLIGLMVATPTEAGYSQSVALRPPAATAAHPAPSPTATGAVAVRPADHGTEVRLQVSGLPTTAGTYYECLWWSADGVRSAGTFRVATSGTTQVELTTAAELRPGWRLAILEHPGGRSEPVTVLSTST